MVGMTISLIGLLAMLALYKNLVQQSLTAARRANSDGQIAAGLLTAQIDLQGAGFGVGSGSADGAFGTDLVMLTDASLDGTTLAGTAQALGGGAASGNAIVWGSRPALSSYECSALLASGGGLILLRSQSSCTAAADWPAMRWQRAADLIAAGTLRAQAASFVATQAPCSPFGKADTAATAIVLQLAATSTVSGLTSHATMCLANVSD